MIGQRLNYTKLMAESKTYKLNHLYFAAITITVFLSLVTVGTLWAVTEYRSFLAESKKIKNEYIENKKSLLKDEVERVLDYIAQQRADAGEITRRQIKARVQEAAAIAEQLNAYYGGRIPKNDIREMFRETLRGIRFFNGRGYYFAFDRNAVEQLFATNPSLEGNDMSTYADAKGRLVVMDMLNIAETQGEGYYEYDWPMPGKDTESHTKIAYVKLIPQFDWIVGVGEYPEAIENDMKQRILHDLSDINIKEAGHIFGATYDGISILGPVLNQNMLDVTDVNGKKIVQELIKAAKHGGGFVEYVMPPFENTLPLPKLSYAAPVPGWDWYVGFGVYIDEIDNEIAAAKVNLNRSIGLRILNLCIVFIAAVLLALLVIRMVTDQFRKSYAMFYSFFKSSVFENEILNLDNFGIFEFREIAKLTNNMVERKKTVDEELHRTLAERSALLKEIHHRVKNNFQAVASLFSLQKRTTDNPEIHAFLDIARNRMYTMAEVHEMLYQADDYSRVSIQEYIEHILSNLYHSLNIDRTNINVQFDVKDITFSIERAIPVGLILNELVTNSCKHAFQGKNSGSIIIRFFIENDSTVLEYSDNGSGFSMPDNSDSVQGFGFQLIETLSNQLGAEIEKSSNDGFFFSLKIPRE